MNSADDLVSRIRQIAERAQQHPRPGAETDAATRPGGAVAAVAGGAADLPILRAAVGTCLQVG